MKIRHHLPFTLCLVALFLLAQAFSPAAQAAPGQLTVMTRNIYFGIDPVPLLTSGCTDFPAKATAAYQEALQSDFPARAAAIAAEIEQTAPDLVGIQEGVIWGELWEGGQVVDFVELIRANLAAAGIAYTPLAVASGLDVTFPTTLPGEVRLQVNDVLLAREGAGLALSNVQTDTYESGLLFPTCIGWVNLPRQWASVEFDLGGETVQVITTHLEAALASTRKAQAKELLAGPAASARPTLVMGDLNSEPETAGDAAALILAAGYAETWTDPEAPDTCCQASDLRNTTSLLDERIDLVLARGDWQTIAVQRVGDVPLSLMPASGVLWSSDHAGVVTSLAMGQEPALTVLLPLVRAAGPAATP